jgi:hypothetical protein
MLWLRRRQQRLPSSPPAPLLVKEPKGELGARRLLPQLVKLPVEVKYSLRRRVQRSFRSPLLGVVGSRKRRRRRRKEKWKRKGRLKKRRQRWTMWRLLLPPLYLTHRKRLMRKLRLQP